MEFANCIPERQSQPTFEVLKRTVLLSVRLGETQCRWRLIKMTHVGTLFLKMWGAFKHATGGHVTYGVLRHLQTSK